MYKTQMQKMYTYDWFCGPGSYIAFKGEIYMWSVLAFPWIKHLILACHALVWTIGMHYELLLVVASELLALLIILEFEYHRIPNIFLV